MSLLLAVRGKAHIVVMADGFSVVPQEKGVRVEREDLPKIFASKEHPFVVAHHGLNKIGAFGTDALLPKLIRDDLDELWSRGLNVSVARVIEALDSTVSQQIKTLKPPWTFGLWLAGLWPCTEIPELVEVLWFRPAPGRVRIDVKTHGDLVWGGSGAKFVTDLATARMKDEREADRLYQQPAEHAIDFLKRLYEAALKKQKQAGETTFGGQARMALITEHGVDLDKI